MQLKYLLEENLIQTRIGVFAQGQILCISPNGLQASHCDAPRANVCSFG